MRAPVMAARIERRLLVNYRVDADVVARLLPEPFRPMTLSGSAVAGICLIRLSGLRPATASGRVGLISENAAHRIAVEWETDEGIAHGVYIPRRDTSSLLTTLAGGRLFPGIHQRARFRVEEAGGRYQVALTSLDGRVNVRVAVAVADDLPGGSVFGSVAAASRFFEQGSMGWSVTRRPGVYQGVELRTLGWRMEPARVEAVASSFFDDPHRFPPGTAELDSALLMRDLTSEWYSRGQLTVRAGRVEGGARPALRSWVLGTEQVWVATRERDGCQSGGHLTGPGAMAGAVRVVRPGGNDGHS
jgi:Uncharacterized conserved protein (COG2071)